MGWGVCILVSNRMIILYGEVESDLEDVDEVENVENECYEDYDDDDVGEDEGHEKDDDLERG